MTSARPTLRERLSAPVAPHSLAVFRIAFGAILLWEVFRFFEAGWIERHYVQPAFHFKYFGFEWVEPFPQPWLDRVFLGLGVVSTLIAIGWWTRVAAPLFIVGFGYVFLLEQARYLNHFYFVLLLALLLVWIPSDRAWSVAAWRRRRRIVARARTSGSSVAIVDLSCPAWALWLVRAQLAIVYGFAAVAKMNGDWIRGQPLRMWLADSADLPWIGPLLVTPWMPVFVSWAGLLLDLLVVPGLLWRRTRAVTFVLISAFHVMNAVLFDIGIFPWLSIAATTIFFAPDWPLRLLRRRRDAATVPYPIAPSGAAVPYPIAPPTQLTPRANVAALALWLAFQVAVPLRHWLYPGEVSWTEEGHRFSWHMKLRSKTSLATFVVLDSKTGERRLVDPAVGLEDWQLRKMADRPDMILQYAHHLADRFTTHDAAGTAHRPRIHAIVDCSLNGRDPQSLIDPTIDLAAEPRSLAPAPWIVPLREPLKPAWQTTEFDVDE